MAIIKCKKCGRDYSNNREVCPVCGTPWGNANQKDSSNSPDQPVKKTTENNISPGKKRFQRIVLPENLNDLPATNNARPNLVKTDPSIAYPKANQDKPTPTIGPSVMNQNKTEEAAFSAITNSESEIITSQTFNGHPENRLNMSYQQSEKPRNKKSIYYIIGGITIALLTAAIIIFNPVNEHKTDIAKAEEASSLNDKNTDGISNASDLEEPGENNEDLEKTANPDNIDLKKDKETDKKEKKEKEDKKNQKEESKKEKLKEETQTETVSTQNNKEKEETGSLSYGKWSGAWKNGKPHGVGKLTFTSSHIIDSRDPQGRTAKAGEYISGQWHNGHLVQGKLYKLDGTSESIIIGRAD